MSTITTTTIKEIINDEYNSYSTQAQNLIAKEVLEALKKFVAKRNEDGFTFSDSEIEELAKEMVETVINKYDKYSNFYGNCVKFEDRNGRIRIYTTDQYCNYLIRQDKKREEVSIADTLYYEFLKK